MVNQYERKNYESAVGTTLLRRKGNNTDATNSSVDVENSYLLNGL